MKNLSRVILSVILASGIIVAIDTDSFANEEVSPTAQQYLMNLSMSQQDAFVLVEECRKTDKPNKCVMYAGAIRAQEGGYNTRHPFGMLRQPSRYKGVKEKTTEQYAELRVGSFTRYRHRNETPSDYIRRSKYCTSGCEHRVSNVTRFISGYDSGVIPQDGQQPTGTPAISYYDIALEATKTRQKLEGQLPQAKNEEVRTRGECIKSGQCK